MVDFGVELLVYDDPVTFLEISTLPKITNKTQQNSDHFVSVWYCLKRYVRYNGTLQRQQTPTTAEGYNNIPVPGINPRLRLNK